MTRVQTIAARSAGLVFTVLSITACQPKPPVLTEKEASYMETLTQKMTTRCFGRYLVDVPEEMVLNTEGLQKLEDMTIDVRPMPERAFDLMLDARTQELKRETLYTDPNTRTLKSVMRLDHADGVIFDRAESPVSNVLRTLELRAWRGGYFIKMEIAARDMSFSKNRFPNDIRETTTPNQLARLLNVFDRTRGRADEEIPTAQGVCIPNGFVSGPPTDEENVGSVYHLKTADDVYFVFGTNSRFAENDSLLDRVDAVEQALKQADGRVLRKGRRHVNGIRGEELLYTVRGDDGLLKANPMTHSFTFEANSRIGSANTPIITIDFYNGVRKPEPPRNEGSDFPPPITKATLSEAESMALWDAVIPTIRPRPGAF
jgi:hypothetical protein